MKAKLLSAWGYQGDNMNLPVADVDTAVPFYEKVIGLHVESRLDGPPKSAILERDGVRMALVENGKDPTEDGCAFRVDDIDAMFAEFKSNGLEKEISDFSTEARGGEKFKVFYVVAPDGLCYWFGQKT